MASHQFNGSSRFQSNRQSMNGRGTAGHKPPAPRRPAQHRARRATVQAIAVVLGPVRRLLVIDVDGTEAHDALVDRLGSEPLAPKAFSGSRKPDRYHLFFRCPDIPTKAKSTPWHAKLEFRGKGGIVIIPPSLHKSGHRYAWADGRSPDDLPLPELPAEIVTALQSTRPTPPPAQDPGEVKIENASPTTRVFLTGAYADGPDWNGRLFRAACDLADCPSSWLK